MQRRCDDPGPDPRISWLLSLACLLTAACDWFPPDDEPCGESTAHSGDTAGATSGNGGTSTGAGSGSTSGDDPSGTSGSSGTASTGESGEPTTGSTGDVDTDADGIVDALDNCPLVANPMQENDDGDPWGDACDSCPVSSSVGGDPTDSCCDPRGPACPTNWGSVHTRACRLDGAGTRFTCEQHSMGCVTGYGTGCSCPLEAVCLPATSLMPTNIGGLVQCITSPSDLCHSRWCTLGGAPDECVGDLAGLWPVAGPDQPTCQPFFLPGTAPAGLEDLGICMKAGEGPCSGLFGIECATWGSP